MTFWLFMCWFQEVLTLRNLWSVGHSVIVSYEHNIASCHGDLWPHIPYWWANKCKAETLIEAFEHRKKQDRPGIYPPLPGLWLFSVCKNSLFCVPGGFFVTGINLTVDLKYICTHPKESLKDLVMSTYSMLLGWVQEQTPGARVGSINIVAGDFVTERHFAPTVVTLNEKLLKRSS